LLNFVINDRWSFYGNEEDKTTKINDEVAKNRQTGDEKSGVFWKENQTGLTEG
jgi:hypothetical protein